MNEYTTSLGKRIEFVPIGPLLDKLNASLPDVKLPTYTIKTATGVEETWPLFEKTPTTDAEWDELIERQDGDENKQAVRVYRVAVTARQVEFGRRLIRLILTRGVNVDIPSDDGWVGDQEFLGFTVPTDPRERRMHFIETEVMATNEDYRQLVIRAFETSEVSEELIAQFEAAFQRKMEERGRTKAVGTTA